MKTEKLLDAMGSIDDTLVAGAEAQPPKKRHSWLKWAAAAACFCLIAAGVLSAGQFGSPTGDAAADSVAHGFCLEGVENIVYYPIAFDERERYGLLPEGAVGLSPENTYQITEADLGELMGTVASCGDESLIDCSVYHFASFPNYDSICILDAPYGYAFYTAGWIDVPEEIGQSSDVVLSAYGLPKSCERIEILMPDWQQLYTVEAPETADAILALLADKSNIGLEAGARRFAQVWQDTYGNDAVHYDETLGHNVYRETPAAGEPSSHTDSAGNTVTESPRMDTSVRDMAHALWTQGERLIQITTDRGFRFQIDYFPAVRLCIWGDGYYELSPEDVAAMNELLQIGE